MKEIFRELAGYWSQTIIAIAYRLKKKEFFYSQEKLKN